MLVFKKTYENVKTKNCNFPVEDQYYANENTAIVADGITRDPIGISDFSKASPKEIVMNYPKPSGAELAAKEIVETFAKVDGTLKEKLIACSKNVKKLNDQYILECDYLQNDYYGAVASCIQMHDSVLDYAYICDCGVIVYDSLGNIKFQTENDKALYCDPYKIEIAKNWHLPESRAIIRREFRNNIQNGKCASYGALTGEEAAIHFIRNGQVKLNSGDIVAVYSDGFANYLANKEFINHLLHFEEHTFDDYVNAMEQEDPNKFGHEKTIIIYKNKE